MSDYSKLTDKVNGRKIQVDSAVRDGNGNKIDTRYITSDGYYEQYIWEGGQYLNIGNTDIDLSNYVQTSRKVAGYALSSDVTAGQIQGALFDITVVSVTERD